MWTRPPGGALLFAIIAGVTLPGCPLTDDYRLRRADSAAGHGAELSTPAGAHSGGRDGDTEAGRSGASSEDQTAGGGGEESGGSSVSGSGGTTHAQGGATGSASTPEGGATTSSSGGTSSMGGSSGHGGTGGASANTGGGTSDGSGGSNGGTNGQGGCSGVICAEACCSGACCNGECIDLESDPENCGSCGTVCHAGRACTAEGCEGGWFPMADPPEGFVARQNAAYVAFDDRLFIFGGLDEAGTALGDAAIYNARTDSWTLVTMDENAPSARQLATALWTGSDVVVLGGTGAMRYTAQGSGAIYSPDTDTWSTITAAPIGHVAPIGIASDTLVGLFGMWAAQDAPSATTQRYSLTSDGWASPTVTSNAPPAVLDPAFAASGVNLYLFGGYSLGGLATPAGVTGDAFVYDLAANSWKKLEGGPDARSGAFSTWDGSSWYVWGGRATATTTLGDGSYRHESAGVGGNTGAGGRGGVGGPLGVGGSSSDAAYTWTNMSTPPAWLAARYSAHRQAGWGFALGEGDIVFLGGFDSSGTAIVDGARYDTANDAWSAIPEWPSGESHEYGAVGLAGGEVILWGGRDANGNVTATGDRWAP